MDGQWEANDILMDDVFKEEEDFLEHYGRSVLEGAPIGSGRYRYGSGDSAYQRKKNFQTTVRALRAKGMSDNDIAKSMQMNSSEFRSKISQNREQIHAYEVSMAKKLKQERGMSNTAIAIRLYKDPKKESTVRNLLKEGEKRQNKIFESTKKTLEDELEKHRMLDVGPGAELNLGVSETRLKNVLTQMEKEGYTVHRKFAVDQYGKATNQKTTVKVLTKDDISTKEVYDHMDEIKPAGMDHFSDDGGMTYKTRKPPESISSDRVFVKYAEDGGTNKDGVIEIRRGVPDLSLGNANYAQVRIAVDNTHYLKGMCMYSDDIPKGYDVVFNTNKHQGTPKINSDPNGKSVLKEMKNDPANPFGANIMDDDKLALGRNRTWTDADGNEHESAIRIVNEEGRWNDWSKNISAQMLSKQPPALAKRQLDITYEAKREQLNDILSLTNPTVKKKLLADFADGCDSDAVHLKAYGFPGQAGKVILPVENLPANQIYAPSYKSGTEVVLIRYPHASITEIPSLTVNNNHKDAKRILGQAIDAVGISPKVAQQLSGADFDGDTVYVIPNPHGDIKHKKQYEALKDFDTKEEYPGYPGMKVISHGHQQKQMGVVTNLITDMTIAGAKDEELVRAIKHSMVIIDSEKHKLDWKRSEQENGIRDLIEKYQVKADGSIGGASTLISRAKSKTYIDQRRFKRIDPETGEKIYEETGKTNWEGKKVQETSTQMADTKDARTLISRHNALIERVYAKYANQMKDLALEARKEMAKTPNLTYDPEARKHYATEVESLKSKLIEAKKNAPLERQALILANVAVKQYIYDNPQLKNDHGALKKLKGRTLNEKRSVTGALKQRVKFTDREWEAVQAGAVHDSFLKDLLKNADSKQVKQLSMPRQKTTISATRKARVQKMLNMGYTQADVADMLDISVSSVQTIAKESR